MFRARSLSKVHPIILALRSWSWWLVKEPPKFRLKVPETFLFLRGKLGRGRSEVLVEVRVNMMIAGWLIMLLLWRFTRTLRK